MMSSMVGIIGPGRQIRNAPNVTFCVGQDSRWVTPGSPLVSPGFAGDVASRSAPAHGPARLLDTPFWMDL
jgi:hypothetical protein